MSWGKSFVSVAHRSVTQGSVLFRKERSHQSALSFCIGDQANALIEQGLRPFGSLVAGNAEEICSPAPGCSSIYVKSSLARTARLVGVCYWRSDCLQCSSASSSDQPLWRQVLKFPTVRYLAALLDRVQTQAPLSLPMAELDCKGWRVSSETGGG
jgi:hypothetical protein